jgi:hypothetical protein
MKNLIRFLRKAWFPLLCLSFVIVACNLNEAQEKQVFSFTTLNDSLTGYDYAVIVLQDGSGKTLDTLFKGPVTAATNLKGLEAPHYKGGAAVIVIQGYKGGVIVYEIERGYDGATGVAQPAIPVVIPSALISLQDIILTVKVGDTSYLPALQLSPSNLSTKQIRWTSSAPNILRADQSGYRALAIGSAWLKAQLGADTTKRDSLKVNVIAKDTTVTPALLERLTLSPETLQVAVSGAPQRFNVAFYPANAPTEIVYGSLDTTVATINASGWVRGIKAAFTRVFVRSLAVAGVTDTAWVNVIPKLAVESVRFKARSLELFQQGASESLEVEVLPTLANQDVDLQVRNTSVAKITAGKIQGLLEGETWLVAKSQDDPSKLDSIKLSVLPSVQVESVTVKPDTLRLYLKGESRALAANIYPVTAQPRFIWSSSAPLVAAVDAAGKVTPGIQGYAYVTAISKADSSKRDSALVLVKKDTPRLAVGPDSTISIGQTVKVFPVAPQDYGLIVEFKADMNGDGTFEVSDTALKAVSYTYASAAEYLLKFYVKDTEGNDTIVTRKIKAVDGVVVQITSPKDGFVTNQNPIDVTWSIDKASRTDKDTLKEGENTIVRSTKDGAGTVVSTSIKVTLDTKQPVKPIVKGPENTVNSRNPTWTWKGGGEGAGTFRILLDATNMAAAKIVTDTFYTVDSALTDGAHILYVQERDLAGNWSQSGQYTIRIDATAPAKPAVQSLPAITNNLKPAWTWNKASDGSGNFEYKMDNGDFSAPGTPTTATEYTPSINLSPGTHSLFVREKDSVGNWSLPGNAQVQIDTIPPGQPKVTGTSPTNLAPAWKWTSGGAGGSGTFRYRLGDSNFPADAAETQDTAYVLNGAVSGTTYTLFVQERDVAGNWSKAGSLPIKFDLTSPTVAISAPQASGTYNTALSAIPMSGTASGPNAISKVTYSIDGGVAANATLGAGGAWSISSIPVADGKTIVVTVTALDVLGNSGFSSLSVMRDNTNPNPPSIKTSPASEVKTTTGAWTWDAGNDGSGSGLSGKYRYNINNGAWTETTALTATNVALTEGDNTFYLQEQDKVGNWSNSATSSVKLDTKGPTLTFTNPTSTGNTYTSTTTPDITIKGTATDAGVGVKSVECDLAGSPAVDFSNGTWTVAAKFPAGTTTVNCWANDNLNTKGPTVLIKININMPKPTIKKLSYVAGMVFNTASFRVNYTDTIDGVASSNFKDVTLSSEGENNVTLTTKATNAVGETGSLNVKYYYRPKAIFVNGSAQGKNDGTSWADAYTNFESAKSSSKAQTVEAQIWMSKGTYSPTSSNDGAELPPSALILGGFDAASLPSDTLASLRNTTTNRTLLLGYIFILSKLGPRFDFNSIEMEDVRMFTSEVKSGANLNFVNCKIWGLKFPDDVWSFETDVPMNLRFIGTDVVSKPGLDEFNMSFASPGGVFTAINSSFTRLETGKYSLFLGDNGGSTNDGTAYYFDNCTLNYEMDNFTNQLNIANPKSTLSIINSRVRYGATSIHTEGTLVYQNNTNLP